jgi:hypothetical protein
MRGIMELPTIINYFAKTYSNVVNDFYSKTISFDVHALNDGIADDVREEIKHAIVNLDKSILVLQDINKVVIRVLMFYSISMIDITNQFLKEAKLYDNDER